MTLSTSQNPPVLQTPSLEKEGVQNYLSSRGGVEHGETEEFRLWLTSKNYSSSTIRNYLSDINAYFNFIRNSKPVRPTGGLEIRNSNIFSSDTISSYLQTIQKNPAYSRYLSSLSKFFQYALDQNLIKIDPLKQAQKVKKPSIDDILSDYQSFLTKKHFSTSTIRNYLNDLHQFIDWSQTNSEPR